MTEREKMISGKLYDSSMDGLPQDRARARKLTFRYNNSHPDDLAERQEILRELLGEMKGRVYIEAPFRCDYGYNITVKGRLYINYNCVMLDCAPITIGENVMMGPNVGIFTAGHPVDPEIRLDGREYAFPVTIGNNVWIGGNVTINGDVTIGDNVVIGSGSVVTRDIPPNVVAAGNPCRVIREIGPRDKEYYFKDHKIE